MSTSLIGSYGPWADALSTQPGSLSFGAGRRGNAESWRTEARARLLDLLGPLPASGGEPDPGRVAVPAVRIRRSYRFEDLEVQELSWQLPYGPETQSVLLKPSVAKGPLPGVLGLHDHASVKYFGKRKIIRTSPQLHPLLREHQGRYYGERAWANELARRGYAVLVHDVIPFGSRRVAAEDLPGYVVRRLVSAPDQREELTPEAVADETPELGWDVSEGEPAAGVQRYNLFAAGHEEVLARSLFAAGTSLPACFVGEDLAALEVLAGRPEVDPERLGCCGLSGGGLRTVFLAGLDDRVACAVCVGFMSTWRDFVLHKSFTHTWMLYVPQLARYLEFPEVLALRVPRPTLVLATDRDPLFTLAEMKRAGEILAGVYAGAHAPERCSVSVYPGPHCFSRDMQDEAFDWLDRWLLGKGGSGGSERALA
jgi:dienelactone hydrolase